jgi:hypothetical protein
VHTFAQDPEADDLFSESFFARLVTIMAGSDVALILNVMEAIYQVRRGMWTYSGHEKSAFPERML